MSDRTEPPTSVRPPRSRDDAAATTNTGFSASTTGRGHITVGPYRLLGELGEGGFGVVFLGERREPFVQRVALKVLKPGIDSHAVIARFEQERQALALMDHPNIARVLDGGLTDAQSPLGPLRPYFVMELVQGLPISRYCEKHKLTLPARLELFLDVCDAVQHAHMKGIIHRDLKPGNILVAERANADPSSGQRPIVKVIDFGIARALSGALTDKTIFTEGGQIMGTPEYMPPEQAGAGDGGPMDIDTRADVYSLGVILYELLTGSLPFEPEELRRGGLLEIVRIIREVEPPKPSTRVFEVVKAARAADAASAATAGLPTTAPPPPLHHTDSGPGRTTLRIRGVEPASLARVLRGDLDWIVMKAMDKVRTRRYESPSSLAADVRRYLRTEPVEAGPPSAGYRLGKFIRRRKGLVTALGACAAAIVLGLVAALYGLREASRERDIAQQERETAVGERNTAMAAMGVLSGVFDSVDPSSPRGDMTVRDLFNEIADDLDRSPPQDKQIEATVRLLVGNALRAVGRPEEAMQQLNKAVDQLRASGKGTWRLSHQVQLARVLAEISRARFATAQRLLDVLLAEWKDVRPDDREEAILYGRALRQRAATLVRGGDARGAVAPAREGLAIAAELEGEDSIEYADAALRLGAVLVEGIDPVEAMKWAQTAIDIRGEVIGPACEPVVLALLVLARCQKEQNKVDECIETLTRAAGDFEQTGHAPNKVFGDVQYFLAVMLRTGGRLREAEDAGEKALAAYEEVAPRSSHVANAHTALAGIDADRGRFARGAAHAEKELSVLRALGADGEENLPRAYLMIALNKLGLGEFQASYEAAGESLRRRRAAAEPSGYLIASAQSVLGAAQAGLGQDEEALSNLHAAAQVVVDDPLLPAKWRTDIVRRLVDFYKARGDKDLQSTWQRRIDQLDVQTPPH